MILTPPPKPTPRINGAKVFGVRPNAPFLFKVAATGEHPLTYTAHHLPQGLEINHSSGLITGTLQNEGDFPVDIKVSNRLGETQRTLTIKVGQEICLTPPMGWNSWYCHSEMISEEAVREVAQAMIDKGLVDHGWSYVNIDDCWQGVRGGNHMAIQPNERFKDMKAMCHDLHQMGLKAGIYSTPWMGTYAGFIGGSSPNEKGMYEEKALPREERLQEHQFFGRYPGSIDKELNQVGCWLNDKDCKQWAEWGFDYVKMDWNPNDVPTTKKIFEDLSNCGRDIVLSLSNATPFENTDELSQVANAWRTTGDIHANWKSISRIGFSQERWAPFTKPGHWNDPDMLQVGNLGTPNRKNTTFHPTPLTPDEQYTQMSLWCILSAPLLLSCDIASLDDFTLSLLTNDEVIEVNQDPLGSPAQRFSIKPNQEVWYKKLEDDSIAIGPFNTGESKMDFFLDFSDLGISGVTSIRDLWRQKDLETFEERFSTTVEPHGVALIKVTA